VATGPLLTASPPALAVQLLQDEHGTDFPAYEVPFTLRVVALQHSVSQTEMQEFMKNHKKYIGLKVAFRPSLQVLPSPSLNTRS
jgi:hypothetical protein